MNKNNKSIIIGILIFFICCICGAVVISSIQGFRKEQSEKNSLNVLMGSENKDLEDIIEQFAKQNKVKINISYAGNLDMISKINQDSTRYDCVWFSNSIWTYMLKDGSKLKYSKATSINPVVFAISLSKARELGFTDKQVSNADILTAVQEGKLKFLMPSVTQTNSGASSYLGFLYCLSGNPEILTEDNINNLDIKNKLTALFSGVTRSSGTDEFIGEMFKNGDYDALVNYESSIINLNMQLASENREPLYLIYPFDGVPVSDSPMGYIDHKDKRKEEIFKALQAYILSDDVQNKMADTGRRTFYGGLIPEEKKNIFKTDWGILSDSYLTPVKYPDSSIINQALILYQNELRKPSYIVFCLDYSGSMAGEGKQQLTNAMKNILDTELAAQELIQFSEKDRIVIMPFNSEVINSNEYAGIDEDAFRYVKKLSAGGGTDIYGPVINALDLLKEIDHNQYNCSIVLMTDGRSNVDRFEELAAQYGTSKVPVFCITFADAVIEQLEPVAALTNAMVFDGKQDLTEAFKTVRGFN